MENVFIDILNMSITASYFVLALIIFRALFRKIPKWLSCVLWGLAGLRLILPFSVESILSLIPSSQTIPSDIMMSKEPHITSGIPILNSTINPVISESFAPKDFANSVNPLQVIMFILSALWLCGIGIMLIYTAVSYFLLRKKTRESIKTTERIYICDTIETPFILGVIRPKIYLPSAISEAEKEFIITHEKAHIKRGDHLWKPLGFLLLSVYWFNPILWMGYIFLCRDIEAACDERVLKEKGEEIKKVYSETLLSFSAPKKLISACPLAFGETGVKERIKNILSYKKPTLWIVIITLIISIVLSFCFMTNPTGMKLTDIDAYGYIFDDVEKIQLFIGSSYIYTTEDIKPEISDIKRIRLEKTPSEETHAKDRDSSYRIEINDEVTININKEFSDLWLDDGTRPSYSYKIKNPDVLKNLFSISNYTTEMNGIYITLKDVKQTDNGISFTVNWHNERSEPVEYGEMFSIERYTKNGTYENVPFPENFVFLLPSYILRPGEVKEKEYSCPMKLTDGSYRFSTTFRTGEGSIFYTRVTFIIGDGTINIGSADGSTYVDTEKILTLDDVISLSQKGKELSWEDFEDFSYFETGSGLYIRVYKIDGRFSLNIGGGGTDTKPMYIYLCAPNGSAGEFIDIRQDDVEAFIEENKDNPIPDFQLNFTQWIFPVDTTGENLNEIIQFGAFLPVNYDRIKTYPTIKLDSLKALNEFYRFFEDKMDFEKLFEDTGLSFSQYKDAGFFENSSFFDEQTLLLIYVTAPNNLNRFDVVSVQPENKTLQINIRESVYETEDNTPTGWLIVIETSKGYTEDIEKINSYIGVTETLPEPQITHTYTQITATSSIFARSVHLYDNGTFSLFVSQYSSFVEYGTFSYEGDLLILLSDDGERRYVFEINSDHITFKRNESVVYRLFTEEELPDKTKFMLQ